MVRFNCRSGNKEDVTPWARFKGGNLTALQLKQLRRTVPTAEEATKNLCTRVVAGGEVSAAVLWPVTLRAAKGGEVTWPGQNWGRDFYQDFVQPSQAVRGDADTPDATAGPHQPGLDFCQQGAKPPVMARSGGEHTFKF